jgi:hypothetical protein
MDSTNTEEKKIVINGTNNRYQVKKLINRNPDPKKRKISLKWNISEEWLSDEKQSIIINELYAFYILENCETLIDDESRKRLEVIIGELNNKITSYKQQDTIRKLLDNNNFIDLNTVVTQLYECKLQCYYCTERMSLLYERVREMKQWSVDRIDNDYGHNRDNIVMACLDCNLKRRCKTKDSFLFTKQLNIVKKDEVN